MRLFWSSSQCRPFPWPTVPSLQTHSFLFPSCTLFRSLQFHSTLLVSFLNLVIYSEDFVAIHHWYLLFVIFVHQGWGVWVQIGFLFLLFVSRLGWDYSLAFASSLLFPRYTTPDQIMFQLSFALFPPISITAPSKFPRHLVAQFFELEYYYLEHCETKWIARV